MKQQILRKGAILFFVFCFLVLTSTATVFAQNAEIQKSDISYFYGTNTQYDSMFKKIVKNLKKFKEKKPNATDEEKNEYAKKLIKETTKKLQEKNISKSDSNLQIVTRSSYYNDMSGYITNNLNSQELQLYNSNTFNALLCMGNGVFAIEYAEDNYISSVLHNGNGDAFRHCLWNYGMVIDVGYSFAKQWSDAHEYGSYNPYIERQMDLYNNSIGLQLGVDNPWTFWHSTFVNKTKEKCRNGQLKIISNGQLVPSGSYGEK